MLEALRLAGHQPFVASRLRSHDGEGDELRQARIGAIGNREVGAAAAPAGGASRARRRELWFTYHLYYKAPDWLGPAISDALGIPYVVAEASHAAKRADGPWQIGHRAVENALRRADLVFGLNPADRDGVLPLLRDPGCWIALPPFLDIADYRVAQPRERGTTADCGGE